MTEKSFVNMKNEALIQGEDWTDFKDALTAVGNTPQTIIINSEVAIFEDLETPETLDIVAQRDGYFNILENNTLTLNGTIEAGDYQIFDGAGSVVGSDKCPIVKPEWWGAVGDDTTDDYSALAKMITFCSTDLHVVVANREYYTESALNFPNTMRVSGLGQFRGSGSNVETNVQHSDDMRFATETSNAIQVNATVSDIIINRANIDAKSYGVLINSGADGERALITDNKIVSENSDAVEVNNTSGNFRDIFVSNNVAKITGGSDVNSGFTYGFAESKGLLMNNNISQRSRQEALHIEDETEHMLINNLLCYNCEEHGAKVQFLSGAGPISINNAYFERDSAGGVGDYGFWNVYDVNGSHTNCNFTNIIVDGFDDGFWIDGPYTMHHLDGSKALNCNVGLKVLSSRITGDVTIDDCTTWVEAGSGAIIDSVKSTKDQKPGTLLSYIGSPSNAGAIIKNIGYRLPNQNFSSGSNSFDFMDLPNRMQGQLTLIVTYGTAVSMYTCQVDYDGATFTEGTKTTHIVGTFGAITVSVNGDQLQATLSDSGPQSDVQTIVDFSGVYYKAS